MKAPRIGRPPVPKKLAKGRLLSVRFSDSEFRALNVAAARSEKKLSAWVREVLLESSRAHGDGLEKR